MLASVNVKGTMLFIGKYFDTKLYKKSLASSVLEFQYSCPGLFTKKLSQEFADLCAIMFIVFYLLLKAGVSPNFSLIINI